MEKPEGIDPQQFENELRKKFVRFQPDENFVKKLSQKLFKKSSISLETSQKFLYNIALILFGFFSGYFLWWIIRKLFSSNRRTKPDEQAKTLQS
jgi:hypothetical protein